MKAIYSGVIKNTNQISSATLINKISIIVQMLTVIGLGSKILVINFMAPNESQGGQVNSAAEICKQIYMQTKIWMMETNV